VVGVVIKVGELPITESIVVVAACRRFVRHVDRRAGFLFDGIGFNVGAVGGGAVIGQA
jgi:hypothetical protein